MRKVRLPDSYSAREIETVSFAGAAAGFIVRLAERDELFKVAVIVAEVAAETCVVVTLKLAEDEPDAIVTLAGTGAAGLLLASRTTVAVCALALNVTVTVTRLPPVTAFGLKVKDETVAAGAVGGGVPVEFVIIFKELPAPLTSIAMSGLPSPLKSLEVMKMLPSLVTAVGLR
jgi:hypothetical protein